MGTRAEGNVLGSSGGRVGEGGKGDLILTGKKILGQQFWGRVKRLDNKFT